jgi:two-component system sensor histidine kinase UhpB
MTQAGRDRPTVWQRLARVPLFYKILAANAAIVTAGAVGGTAISIRHGALHPGAAHYDLIVIFVAAGVAVSLAANYLVLRAVLRPLDHLQRAVNDVQAGASGVRVERAGLTDERFDHLADTFDQMIETQERDADRLRHLAGQILRAQEEERRRIARELHDEAAQSMTSLLVRLRLLEQARTPDVAQQRVQELRELTTRALDDVRRIAVELRPSVLDDLGLVDALHAHIDGLNRTGAVRTTCTADGLDGARLPAEVELALYRVAQEALTNVRRHAGATQAKVRLTRAGGAVELLVEDDGAGFDPSRPRAETGLGLAGMRERMALIGGSLAVRSAPGQGTKIIATANVQR